MVPYEFLDCFFISVKNGIGILIEIALNLQIALSSIGVLTILIPPDHEHGMSFHLCVSFKISFIGVLVSSVQVFYLLVKFIWKHFIPFNSIYCK